ncbi:MAG: Grx4 family monothiol glutaredoxin [Myxococcales bacterium]|nr:Grx4 family monothiol glutaredoxin [Myxococcales bacterium]
MTELEETTRKKISDHVASGDIVLFMKGRRRMPQCGFSAQLVGILDQLVENYSTVNVLMDPEVREGIKVYSSWPTIPQLYVKGKFIGGCDIVSEMFEAGELQELLGVKMESVSAPSFEVSDAAKRALTGALTSESGEAVRLTIDARFRATMGIDGAGPMDLSFEANGVSFVVDRGTAKRSHGLKIDFVEGESGGFRLENPNEPPKVVQMAPATLVAWQKEGKSFQLVDVRTEDEVAKAKIAGAQLLDATYREALLNMPKDTPLVFHCHHGGRSQAAAEFFLGQGFTKVHNLAGGIDAWSVEIDSTVPRY